MQKLNYVLFFVLLSLSLFGQDDKSVATQPQEKTTDSLTVKTQDSLAVATTPKEENRKSLLDRLTTTDADPEKANIEDYLIISVEHDTTYVDTTLSIQKDYKYNYLRRDNFGLIPFTNIGQTYNSLTYDFKSTDLIPSFGARARHFNYMEVEDIYYYNVPTPLTELLYKTAFEQGQLLDSFITVNVSPQLNFSIAYKGLRSLGQYQNILTSTGNFRATSNYKTKNERYKVRLHIVTQDLSNQENGGLQEEDIPNFESGEEEFLDRPVFDPNFDDAENILEGKRFFLDHNFSIFDTSKRKKDTLKTNTKKHTGQLSVNHTLMFEDKFYQFDQEAPATELFGEAFQTSDLRDRVTLEHLNNTVALNYKDNLLGTFGVNASSTHYNYGYDKIVILNGETITNRLRGEIIAAGANYKKFYKGFNLKAAGGVNITGDFEGNFLTGEASIQLSKDAFAKATITQNSKAPNFNTLLYQSTYRGFNWQNNFSNTETQQLALQLKYKKLVNLTVDYTNISDYVYFAGVENTEFEQQIEPLQNDGTISYLRAKLENEITVGKFSLNNTVLYQSVDDNEANILNVPEITTRNTLYYSSHLFKRAMFLQTGITLNYFTKFFLNAYNPLLAEFYVQNEIEFGEFPRLDFFINAKIRQTRIFLKAEHFNSSFTGFDFYSAPNVPYRDFTVRFGLVWNFFL